MAPADQLEGVRQALRGVKSIENGPYFNSNPKN
jgi:hypothetical protein